MPRRSNAVIITGLCTKFRMFHVKQSTSETDLLRNELSTPDMEIDHWVIDQCLDYWNLLCEASDRLNLISKNAVKQGPLRHIGDSLAALIRWPSAPSDRLLDIGSGGGLPGLPLAIARPRAETLLLEAKEKKRDWLVATVKKLGLQDKVTVVSGRIEKWNISDLEEFETVTARAVAPPPQLFKWVLPALGPESQLLLWHSQQQKDEIIDALRSRFGGRMFELNYTSSHVYSSINFSSHISSISETR